MKDALDRPLPDVLLKLQAADGSNVAQATSGVDGRFVLEHVPPGTYAIQASKKGFETGTAIVTVGPGPTPTPELVLASRAPLDVQVVAKKLNEARNQILTRTGSSQYAISKQAIQAQPGGENAPLNQTLLRAPGVVQDSFGQVHVRGDHANLQFRINGVLLPEGVNAFGQTVGSRFIEDSALLDGALPAQYGFRTAGIVDIQTKSGADAKGATVDFYGGSHDRLQPSIEAGGTAGPITYYVTGQYLHDELGVENPTDGINAIHDTTNQGRGFTYLSGLLDATTRVSFMAGAQGGRFQLPNTPGLAPSFMLAGVPSFDSAKLNETQQEQNYFGVLALQKSLDRLDYQLALFSRYSRTAFNPDFDGDLLFNGVASDVVQSAFGNGIQGDASYRLNDSHTLRFGFLYLNEHTINRNDVSVFPADALGNQISSVPFSISQNGSKAGNNYGFYGQDEWRLMPQLTLNYGLRIDFTSAYVTAKQVSPRVNLVYRPFEGTTLHVGYARYFTPPPQELVAPTNVAAFNGTTNQAEVQQDTNVKAERSNYFDAGVTQEVFPGLQIGLDGYYKQSTHLIDEGQFGQALILSPFNYHEGRIYGAELTGSYQWGGLTTYANLAYSVAKGKKIESGQFQFDPAELAYISDHWVHLDHDQAWTASLGASYLWRGTRFSVDTIMGSGLRSGFANTDKLPSYQQVNLGLSHKFELGGKRSATVRFDLINLLDHSYEIRDGSGIGVGAPQFGPRRAYYGGISFNF